MLVIKYSWILAFKDDDGSMGRFGSFEFGCARGFAAAVILVVAIAVPWGKTGELGSVVAATLPGDELLTVNCLLPGKVRKLGRRFTFVTPRRAVRIAASDCKIRGGEYTTYDAPTISQGPVAPAASTAMKRPRWPLPLPGGGAFFSTQKKAPRSRGAGALNEF